MISFFLFLNLFSFVKRKKYCEWQNLTLFFLNRLKANPALYLPCLNKKCKNKMKKWKNVWAVIKTWWYQFRPKLKVEFGPFFRESHVGDFMLLPHWQQHHSLTSSLLTPCRQEFSFFLYVFCILWNSFDGEILLRILKIFSAIGVCESGASRLHCHSFSCFHLKSCCGV